MAIQRNRFIKKFLIVFFALIISTAGLTAWHFIEMVYVSNVEFTEGEKTYLFIPTGCSFEQLIKIVKSEKKIISSESFEFAARRLFLEKNIHPGRYEIKRGMNNFEIVKLLRSGRQTPVKIVINKIRTPDQFAEIIGTKIECGENGILNFLKESDSLMTFVIPNTYEFYWNTSAEGFFYRMKNEFNRFWSAGRREKAATKGLSIAQVMIVASIVEEETNHDSEKPMIAAVYLNRLKKGMMLQADPTIKFALNDFSIKRIKGIHIEIASGSLYNTYRRAGLPPFPICTPSAASIDAVLNAPDKDYLYFCASVTQPGYHEFAGNFADHQKNAKAYHAYLNHIGIH